MAVAVAIRLAEEITEELSVLEMDEADANIINCMAGALVCSEVEQQSASHARPF
ncbi:MAG: hypothetical protein GY821_05760 [Gammaproteobacteria bacterium]|nr:hypothetical protein [Gammaproteobacteria bacterium]